MSRIEQPNLNRGACLDLLPEVVDKYFMANGNTERFQVATAKAICGRCAVRAACLMDSIKVPWPSGGIRGGECDSTISELHRRYEAGEDLDALTIETLRKQQPMRGRQGGQAFRAGRFVALELCPRSRSRSTLRANQTSLWNEQRVVRYCTARRTMGM